MSKIHQLDSQTANLIAAGEVVERPQGVVKELVENAIDAGSTRIVVSAVQGGIQKVTVTDNGCGMSSEDASLAFYRHATSKIANGNDLSAIHTLGFRGEALPSIAAVSKLTMCTCDGNDFTRIVYEYGKMASAEPYPCPNGTEITVEGLFYRTPARLKHLKSGAYENSLIQSLIMQFAMSHPEISFSYISDGKEAYRTTGSGDLLEVLYLSWGREPAENAIPIHLEDFDYRIDGYIVKPHITRASRSFMHVFLNGRMVHTFRLYKAIQDGYEDYISRERCPLAVLNVRMDPHLLDVNVHPSKWEVRISKENQLEYLIRDGVKETLEKSMLAPNAHSKTSEVRNFAPMQMEIDETPRQESFVQEPEQVKSYIDAGKTVEKEHAVQKETVVQKQEESISQILSEEENSSDKSEKKEVSEVEQREESLPSMGLLGQLHGTWIIAECPQGLAVFDQHACMERIQYEKALQAMEHPSSMHDLLVPVTVHCGEDIVHRYDELNKTVSGLEVAFEPFGEDTLALRSVPSWMQNLEEKQVAEDLIDAFRNDEKLDKKQFLKKEFTQRSSHSSVNGNSRLSREEMQKLLDDLSVCRNPWKTPAGKNTLVIIEEKDLVRSFHR